MKWHVFLQMTIPSEHLQDICSDTDFHCYIPMKLQLQMMTFPLYSWNKYHLVSPETVPAKGFQSSSISIKIVAVMEYLERQVLRTHCGSARSEWTIRLIYNNRIGHIVHDNFLKCHIGGCAASRRISPCLNPDAIRSIAHFAVFDN